MAKEINIKFVFEKNEERFEPLSVEYETGNNRSMLAYCLAYIAATESLKKPCFIGHFEKDLKLLLLENVLEKLNGDN
ncbi:hypothetical protein GYN24_10610 [Lactococcus piscium]|uniref:Uncharacterized protein n=1 Tax=Pseudolactococcus paracarnosus TaxID=2749962 RepID=A0A7L4WFZ2_9LACT|nr:hypothetical protein [Lactococcus paracarnosus]MCJ1995030.1 hypothetical protein [Lactococcus paracarnosus]QDJ28235.1 hypothetical protein BHS01_06745 [Lactococcus paracarnosus]SPC35361.1 conserved hypothetical protein [Lactococcus piscium]